MPQCGETRQTLEVIQQPTAQRQYGVAHELKILMCQLHIPVFRSRAPCPDAARYGCLTTSEGWAHFYTPPSNLKLYPQIRKILNLR